MSVSLEWGLPLLLRLVLGLAFATAAVRLAMAWLPGAAGARALPLPGQWAAALGAASSVGTGLVWLQALAPVLEPAAAAAVDSPIGTVAMVGVAAAAALAAAIAWRGSHRLPPLPAAAMWGVAGAVALALVVGVEAGRTEPPVAARGGIAPVGIAWAAVLGCVLASLALLGLWAAHRRFARWQATLRQTQKRDGAQALSDALTGLPGRLLFEGTLAQAVSRADALGQSLALLHIGIDDFGQINQSLGHDQGDRLLRKVAARLRPLVRPHMAARLGGDEFLLLLADEQPTPDRAAEMAAAVQAALARPCQVAGRQVHLACSIGVVMYPDDGARPSLISHAGAAMRAAKAGGGGAYAFFDPSMSRSAREQGDLLKDLRAAIADRQFELFYQPKVHAPSGEITGAEALLRWHHPRRGMVSPDVFLPLAERHGLINALGAWVIDEACRQARRWRDGGLRMRVAINLSVLQLRQRSLAAQLRSALHRHGVNPELITCEITETTAMDDTEVTNRVLAELHEIGVSVSIDDFGTGHSSLAHLRKLSAQELKIDRSFVSDLETSEEARQVACAVINLAKALSIKVVAEGVETEGQYRLLRSFGCDELQGFLFAKPMTADALARWAIEDDGPRTMIFRASLFTATRQLTLA